MQKQSKEWVAKVAKANNTTEGEVMRYLRSLSSGKRVIHHLNLTPRKD